jgi:hypothetical protein
LLNNPAAAAECLLEGGFLIEAAETFERVGRWLEAADVYERLGRKRDVERLVRMSVEERLANNDLVGAARLLHHRLNRIEEALEVLRSAWPNSSQAGAALELYFHLLHQADKLEEIRRFIESVDPRTISSRHLLPALRCFLQVATGGNERAGSNSAKELCYSVISHELSYPRLPTGQQSELLRMLPTLAGGDPLVQRDAGRYAVKSGVLAKRVRIDLPPLKPNQLVELVRRFDLPRQIEWLQVRIECHWFFAIGVTANRCTILRGTFEGEFQSLSWECPANAIKNALLFEPTVERGTSVAVSTVSGPPFSLKTFPAADLYFEQECSVSTPTWLPSHTLSVVFGEANIWTLHLGQGKGLLSVYSKSGALIRTEDITMLILRGATESGAATVHLAPVGSGVAIAYGTQLLVPKTRGGFHALELPDEAIALVPSLPHTRSGLAIFLNDGIAFHWLGSGEVLHLEKEFPKPIGCFVPGGPLVTVSGNTLLVLDVAERSSKVRRTRLEEGNIIGLAPAGAKQFATFSKTGQVTVYKIADPATW